MFGKAGWHINHIIRVALGGTNERYNLEAICHTCHIIITAEERIRDGF
jgi:5-methylcytosine-specific restriction endonuclease McrA